MPGQLLEIRKKIGGVKNTRKITKAMQLVAASKMRQFQKKATSTRAYIYDLLNVIERNLKIDDLPVNQYTTKRDHGPILFVAYTSDKGLCGGLNNNLLRSLIRSEKWLQTKPEDRLLITIGRKSREFARVNSLKAEHSFVNVPDKMTTLDALKIVDVIMSYWHKEIVREIIFLSPHYKNSFTYYPNFKTLLPCSLDMIESNFRFADRPENKTKFRSYMIYEPSRHRVFETLFEQMVEGLFIQSFFELKASEYSSRMIAMQNATDNADRIMDDLTLIYNKTRQQVITQELSELIGASEAISKG